MQCQVTLKSRQVEGRKGEETKMIPGHGMANSKIISKRLKRQPNLYVCPVYEQLSCNHIGL